MAKVVVDFTWACGDLQSRYRLAGGKKKFDWASIMKLITDFLGGCTAKDTKDNVKEHPVACAVLLRRRLITSGLAQRKDAQIIADAGVDQVNDLSVKNVQAIKDSVPSEQDTPEPEEEDDDEQ